jgi:cystathionine beta-lyase
MQEATRLIQSVPVDPLTGAISVPIYQTSTFVQEAPGVNQGYDYARTNNPTRAVLEKMIAELEQGHSGYAFASGLAAIDAVIKLLKAGDEIIAVDDIYGGAFRQFTQVWKKFGIQVKYVDTTDAGNIPSHMTEATKMIWIETPTNPTLKISDIREIAKISVEYGCLLCVDNTFASPVLQKPLLLGADIVLHSATKYLGGHSDLIAGLVVVKDEGLAERVKFIQNACGAILSPHDSWLVIRGMETLPVRMKVHCDNAVQLAQWLETHPAVDKVYYPGLPGHLNRRVVEQQCDGRGGGIVSFTLVDDREKAAVEFLRSTKLFRLAESLGGVKSLCCHPASMTHKSIPADQRRKSGVSDSLVRLSVGLEDAGDLVSDLEQAFEKISLTENLFA